MNGRDTEVIFEPGLSEDTPPRYPLSAGTGPMRLGQALAKLSAELAVEGQFSYGENPAPRPRQPSYFPRFPHGGSSDVFYSPIGAYLGRHGRLPPVVIGHAYDSERAVIAVHDSQSLLQPVSAGEPQESRHAGEVVLTPNALGTVCELLAELWIAQTRGESSLERIFEHPAFAQIVEFGQAAIPFMLSQLKKHPERWSVGVELVTGETPVPPGTERSIAIDAWERWGSAHGY